MAGVTIYRQEGRGIVRRLLYAGEDVGSGRMWVRDEARASRRAAGAQVSRARGPRGEGQRPRLGHGGERWLVWLGAAAFGWMVATR